jgi:ABC-2 type transport system permease protein
MIAMNSAAFSIVEEKLSRSLEPLLATPVKTGELLLGKALAGAIPALIITWVCALILLLAVAGIGWGNLVGILITPVWFISLFLLTPAITVLSFLLGIIGSSRARDAKSAQNTAVFIILPIFLLIALQVTGLVWFTPPVTLMLVVLLGLIDVLVLRLAGRVFQRESIVIRWQ